MTNLQTYVFWFLVLLMVAFIVDEPAISAIRASDLPLNDIGKSVSWLGNSKWSGWALLMFSFVMALIAQNASDPMMRSHAKLLLTAAVMVFIAGLLSGIAVQLLKHGFGRARPGLFDELGAYSFQPFAFSTRLNSFPSGHSSTIGALAMAGALLIPKYRLAFAALALIVGFGRILDGAHYVSDVWSGLVIGAGTTFLLLHCLVEKRVLPPPNSLRWAVAGRSVLQLSKSLFHVPRDPLENDVRRLQMMIGVLILITVASILFISRPEIDIGVSKLFFDEVRGFWLNNDPILQTVRKVFHLSVLTTTLFACLMWYASLRCRDSVQVHPAVWGFGVTSIVVGPGLVANALLKDHWGRARPASVTEFGGEATFTFPFEIANECDRNCSFVSGEGSGIAMLLFVGVALAWPIIRKAPLSWLTPLGLIALFGISMRIMKGRHFASDSVFAVLIMALVVLVLFRTFEIKKHRENITQVSLWHDLRVFQSYLSAPYSESRSVLHDGARALRAVARIGTTAGKVFTSVGSYLSATFVETRQWLRA